MVRLVPALLALFLLLSAPGVSALAGTPDVPNALAQEDGTAAQIQPANTTSLLLLDDVQASNVTEPEPSLATTLSMRGSELDGRFEARVIELGLANRTGESREEYAFIKAVHLRNEVEELLAEEHRAREAYVDGELSAGQYLRTVARLSARGEAIRPSSDALQNEGGDEIERQLGFVRSDLPILSGPILERISGGVRGDAAPPTVHVEASSNGFVLSRISGETYVREAYRRDLVNKEGLELSFGGADTRVREWYPWATGPDFGPSAIRFGPTAWEVKWSHEHATIRTYFYGNTSGPYREVQHKTLPEYPFDSAEVTFTNDVVLAVNETYPGGPMAVRLTNSTGAPLDGEIRIDGSSVGSTGPDGTLWVLQPDGAFTVAAVHEGDRLSLDLGAPTAEFVDEQ